MTTVLNNHIECNCSYLLFVVERKILFGFFFSSPRLIRIRYTFTCIERNAYALHYNYLDIRSLYSTPALVFLSIYIYLLFAFILSYCRHYVVHFTFGVPRCCRSMLLIHIPMLKRSRMSTALSMHLYSLVVCCSRAAVLLSYQMYNW